MRTIDAWEVLATGIWKYIYQSWRVCHREYTAVSAEGLTIVYWDTNCQRIKYEDSVRRTIQMYLESENIML